MRKRALVFLIAALALPAQAQIFGPSDEEKAHEAGQDDQLQKNAQDIGQLQSQVRDLSDRMQSLTESLARATGANEELAHRLDLLADKLDRQQKDFSYRLCMLSAQQLGADTDASGLNCAAAGTQSAPRPTNAPQALTPGAPLAPLGDAPLSASGAPTRGRPPGTLGMMPSTGAPPPMPSANSGQFDVAMNLLAKAQYDEARAGFRAYADNNSDDLAPQAIFWVGDIDFVRRDYPSAARDFAELIKKYPTSARAPDAMFKLGQSLLEMGQKSEGCTTLGALKSKFPNADPGTLSAAQGARKAACS